MLAIIILQAQYNFPSVLHYVGAIVISSDDGEFRVNELLG